MIDQKIDELNSGYYRLKRCEVKKLCGDVKVLLDSSQVSEMYDSSTVRDFKNFPKIKIIVPEGNSDNFEMIVSKNTGKN